MPDESTRRKFLAGLAATTGLAGCADLGNSDGTRTEAEETASPTEGDTPTDTTDMSILSVVPTEDAERTESPVFSATSTDNEYDTHEVDLERLNSLHENELYHVLEENPEWREWLETLPDDSRYRETKTYTPGSPYQNYDDVEPGGGVFSFEEFSDSDRLQDSLNWLHTYVWAWDITGRNGDIGYDIDNKPLKSDKFSHPDENWKFSLLLEEPVQRHTGLDVHVWPIEIYESKTGGSYSGLVERDEDPRYGMMLGWDAENEEVLIVEATPYSKMEEEQHNYFREELSDRTRSGNEYVWARKLHPKTTNSVYLPGVGVGEAGMTAVDEYWHPLRFDGEAPDVEGLDYGTASQLTGQMLRGMVSSTEDGDITRRLGEDANVAITNQYLDDITDATVQPGEAPVEFQDVYDQAKVVHDLAEAEGNYVVFGDPYEEPMYAKVEDEEVIDQVWQDEQGEFDNFAQVYDELDAPSAS